MALFEWNEIYNTGIQDIDEQHQKLFTIINTLHKTMKEGKGNSQIDSIQKELLEYVFYHFNSEEDAFAKFNYPEFHQHRAEHDSLTKKLLIMREKFKAGNTFIAAELITFLKSWLTIHILQSDIKFSKFMKITQVQQKSVGV